MAPIEKEYFVAPTNVTGQFGLIAVVPVASFYDAGKLLHALPLPVTDVTPVSMMTGFVKPLMTVAYPDFWPLLG